jgi:hypothetical protein
MFDCGYERSFCEYLKAGDPSARPEELAILAEHSDYRVRRRVAENTSTPEEVLKKLVKDADSDVRIAVGTNPITETHLKLRLSCDADTTVRLGLAQDITTPEIVLHQLINDDNAWVSGEARRTLQIQQANNQRSNASAADFMRFKQNRGQNERLA